MKEKTVRKQIKKQSYGLTNKKYFDDMISVFVLQ